MELEEAIKRLKGYENKLVYEISEKDKEAVAVVLNHLTKQDKMIENIFSYLDDNRIDDNICDEILNYGAKDCIYNGNCVECIKQYFEKKKESRGE